MKIFNRIISILALVTSIIFLVLICTTNLIQKDYTKTYFIYKDVKDFTEVSELKAYLSGNRIEYSIEAGKLSLKEHDLITFSINSGTCVIIPNNTMEKFQDLDEKNLSTVKVSGTVRNNVLVEEVSIKENGIRYFKVLDKYYELNISKILMFFIICILIILISTTNIIRDIYEVISNKTKKSKDVE